MEKRKNIANFGCTPTHSIYFKDDIVNLQRYLQLREETYGLILQYFPDPSVSTKSAELIIPGDHRIIAAVFNWDIDTSTRGEIGFSKQEYDVLNQLSRRENVVQATLMETLHVVSNCFKFEQKREVAIMVDLIFDMWNSRENL